MDNAKLTSDLDLDFSAGYVPWATENEAIRQHILIRLSTFKGEWFLDSEVGTPYREYVLGSRNKPLACAVLAEQVLKTPDVLAPLLSQSYSFNNTSRHFEYGFSCTTKYGDLNFLDIVSL